MAIQNSRLDSDPDIKENQEEMGTGNDNKKNTHGGDERTNLVFDIQDDLKLEEFDF